MEPWWWHERLNPVRDALPDKIHAKCPVCGGGGDYPASALTGADSQSNIDTEAYEQNLVWHEGELMCELCKKNRILRSESHLGAEKHSYAQAFRNAVGFTKTVS